MAESIIAPSLSLRDKFDLLNSAKEIISIGETKTFSGKKYTQAEALTKLRSHDMSDLVQNFRRRSIHDSYYDKLDSMIPNKTYFEYTGPWKYAAIFINFFSIISSSYSYGVGCTKNGGTLNAEYDVSEEGVCIDQQYQRILALPTNPMFISRSLSPSIEMIPITDTSSNTPSFYASHEASPSIYNGASLRIQVQPKVFTGIYSKPIGYQINEYQLSGFVAIF